MSELVNKEELLRRIDESSNKLADILTRILSQKAMEPGAVGTWSVKDVLAHFIAWQQFSLSELQAGLAGQPLPPPPPDLDLFNAQVVDAGRGLPYDVVLGNWRHSVQDIKDTLAAIPDAEFMPNSNVQGWLGGATINDILANNTYEHWDEHLPAIESWVADR